MPVSGYDPEDLENALRERLERADSPETLLSEEERRAWASGEELIDALDEETIGRLIHEED